MSATDLALDGLLFLTCSRFSRCAAIYMLITFAQDNARFGSNHPWWVFHRHCRIMSNADIKQFLTFFRTPVCLDLRVTITMLISCRLCPGADAVWARDARDRLS